MLRIGAVGLDAKWSKSGEWTLTKQPEIQYALWLWVGVVRNRGTRAVGIIVGPIKFLVGVIR